MSQFSSHSADVKMWLECGAFGRVELSRITPTLLVGKPSHDVPACDADLVITIDGRPLRSRVNLSSGFSKRRQAARFAPVTEVAPF
jgi:hypothetical protein